MSQSSNNIGKRLKYETFMDDARPSRTPRKQVEYADAVQDVRVIRYDEWGRKVIEK